MIMRYLISSACPKYRIASTGECIEECPTSSHYFSYKYSFELKNYKKENIEPLKYLYNNLCYEACPKNTLPNANKECICIKSYYKDKNNNIICLSDMNCNSEYPYINQDTKECFDSLEKCNYFFKDTCYSNNCPDGTVSLSSQIDEVKNYIREKLSINDDNLINKICICDITRSVWTNMNS